VNDVSVPDFPPFDTQAADTDVLKLIDHLKNHPLLEKQTSIGRDELEILILSCHDLQTTLDILNSFEDDNHVFPTFKSLQQECRNIYSAKRMRELVHQLVDRIKQTEIQRIIEHLIGYESPESGSFNVLSTVSF